MTDKGQDLLADLPPYLQSDDTIRAVIDATAAELQRIEDFVELVRTNLHPQNADDTYGILGAWERLVGLPVQPTTVSLDQRRLLLLTALRRRQLGSGEAWTALITAIMGGGSFTAEENTPEAGMVFVVLPIEPDDYRAGQLRQTVALVSPAHLEMNLSFGGRYEVGIAEVGDPL